MRDTESHGARDERAPRVRCRALAQRDILRRMLLSASTSLLAFLALVSPIAHAQEPAPATSGTPATMADAGPPAQDEPAPPDGAQVEALRVALEAAFGTRDLEALRKLGDPAALESMAASDLELDAPARARLHELCRDALFGAGDVAPHTDTRCVGYAFGDSNAFLRFVRLGEDGGWRLFELELRRAASGDLRVCDRWDADSIGWVSQRAWFTAFVEASKAPDELADELVALHAQRELVRTFLEAARAGNGPAARAALAQLPEDVRDHATLLDPLLHAGGDGKLCELGRERLRAAHPDLVTAAWIGLERDLAARDVDASFAQLCDFGRGLDARAIDPLIAWTSAWELLRARRFDLLGDAPAACECAERAVIADPACAPAWRRLARAAFESRDMARVAALLADVRDVSPALADELVASSAAQPFRASPEHAAWKAGPPKGWVRFDESCALASRWLTAQRAGDLEALQSIYDMRTMCERATAGAGKEPFRKAFIEGLRSTMDPQLLLSASLGADFSASFLRSRRRGEARTLLFCARSAEGALSYLECVVGRDAAGEPRLVDLKQFAAGEWTSVLLRRMYLPFAAEQEKGLIDKLLGTEQLIVRHVKDFGALSEAAKQGDATKARKLFDALPAELRRDRVVLLLLLRATQNGGEELYLATLAEMERELAGDPCLDLISIDLHFLRKRFDLARASLDRLEAAIGGDGYLDSMRANTHLEGGDLAVGERFARRGVARDPDQLATWWPLVTVLLRAQRHAAVTDALIEIDRRFAPQWNDFAGVAEYADYAASPEIERWKAYLAAK